MLKVKLFMPVNSIPHPANATPHTLIMPLPPTDGAWTPEGSVPSKKPGEAEGPQEQTRTQSIRAEEGGCQGPYFPVHCLPSELLSGLYMVQCIMVYYVTNTTL